MPNASESLPDGAFLMEISLRTSGGFERLERTPHVSHWPACCSDSGDDLDPSVVHRFGPLSLCLGILVWDSADGAMAPAVLVDLVRMWSDDDLVDRYLPSVGLDDH
jgi:hypothetical protein